MVEVGATTWNRFLTGYLAIVPELLGRAHEFIFDQRVVVIELPTDKEIAEDSTKEGRAEIFSWRIEDGKEVPTRLWVNSVDICVRLDKKISIPQQILKQAPNAYDILPEDKQQCLEKLAESYGSIAERAFDTWIRTLRWKTNNSLIGRPDVIGPKSGWGTYLVEEATRHRFWVATQGFRAPYSKPVTIDEWIEAEQALKDGVRSPVYYDLMFDAEEHLRLEDLQRSVVDAAVACESYMRLKVMQKLPLGLTEKIRRYIDEANIRQVLNNFFPDIIGTEEKRNLESMRSTLHQLFDDRNTILHSGRADLTVSQCQKYIDATERLIRIG